MRNITNGGVLDKVKVIGVGNRLMGDDGIGVYIVEQLIKDKFLFSNRYVDFYVAETDINYLIHTLISEKNMYQILFIDAAEMGKMPGSLEELNVDKKDICTKLFPSPHSLNFTYAIKANDNINNITNMTILGIEPEIIDFRFGLGPSLSREFKSILEKIKNYILCKYV